MGTFKVYAVEKARKVKNKLLAHHSRTQENWFFVGKSSKQPINNKKRPIKKWPGMR